MQINKICCNHENKIDIKHLFFVEVEQYGVGMIHTSTSAIWREELMLSPQLKRNNIYSTKSTYVSNSKPVWCTPLQCWQGCRSHKFGSGLYVDIRLGTSVSFSIAVFIFDVSVLPVIETWLMLSWSLCSLMSCKLTRNCFC